jgi:probable F420-dependent oxidoreductase
MTRLSVTGLVTDRSASVVDLVHAIADRGLHAVYLPEHTHFPVATASPVRGRDDLVRDEFRRLADPIVALAAAAVAEPRLCVGTGALLVAQHDPILLAKQLATLELMAPGRVRLGVGFGWNELEAANHGIDPSTRRTRGLEHLEVMRRLWSDETVTFAGRFVTLSESIAWPKPTTPIPVLLAGRGGTRLFADIVEYGDGWMPIYRPGLSQSITRLRQAFEAAGRAQSPDVVVLGLQIDDAALRDACSSGADEVVVRIDFTTVSTAYRDLDRLVETWARLGAG